MVIIFCYYYYNKNLKKDVLVYKTIAEEYGDGVQVAGRGDVFKKFFPKRLKDLPLEQQKRMNTLIDEEIKEREIMRKKKNILCCLVEVHLIFHLWKITKT